MSYRNYLVKEAVLPRIPDCPDLSVLAAWNDETRAQLGVWQKAKEEHQRIVIPDIGQIQEFACRSSRLFITGHEKENFLYSPVGLWFCLHTLSNLTGGNSEAQIRHALRQQSEEARGVQPDAVFRSL